jgi:uncharacterized membrane protein
MDTGKKHIFDKPENIKLALRVFYAICALLFIADFFVPKHGVNYWEDVPQFFAAFGLIACILLVLVSRFILRPLVKRKEDYYD